MASTAQGVAPPPSDIATPITQAAKDLGVDPVLAFAIAFHESGYSPTVVGDNGCSHGLFQLNTCGGEGTGMSLAQLEDPYTNARTALTEVAAVAQAHPDWSPGQIAAAAQRPADPAGYANAVNSIYYTLLGVAPGTSTGGVVSGSTTGVDLGLPNMTTGIIDLFNGLLGPGPLHVPGGSDSGSSSGSPLSVDTFKLAARDAIQLALGGLLIWFGVETIVAELTGTAVTTTGKKMLGRGPAVAARERATSSGRARAAQQADYEREAEQALREKRARQGQQARRSETTGYRPRRPSSTTRRVSATTREEPF